jgi:hypothetical protein
MPKSVILIVNSSIMTFLTQEIKFKRLDFINYQLNLRKLAKKEWDTTKKDEKTGNKLKKGQILCKFLYKNQYIIQCFWVYKYTCLKLNTPKNVKKRKF